MRRPPGDARQGTATPGGSLSQAGPTLATPARSVPGREVSCPHGLMAWNLILGPRLASETRVLAATRLKKGGFALPSRKLPRAENLPTVTCVFSLLLAAPSGHKLQEQGGKPGSPTRPQRALLAAAGAPGKNSRASRVYFRSVCRLRILCCPCVVLGVTSPESVRAASLCLRGGALLESAPPSLPCRGLRPRAAWGAGP